MTTSLPTARLGSTDMQLTRVGFGAWAIGGGGWAYAWGDQDDTESITAIRSAVESGINWIDTAAVYGLGSSEEVVAAALAGLPEADRPYVFTKGGLVWDPAARSAAPRRVGDPASLRGEVEASLRRLKVERIDLYQMHWPAEDGTALEDYWQVFLDLKREGKIRADLAGARHGAQGGRRPRRVRCPGSHRMADGPARRIVGYPRCPEHGPADRQHGRGRADAGTRGDPAAG